MNFKMILSTTLFIAGAICSANSQTVTANASMIDQVASVLNLGDKGIAVVGHGSGDKHHVVRIGADGKLMWEKDVTTPKNKQIFQMEASSANGNDIYLLSFEEQKEKGGGKNPALVHIDAATGENKLREWEMINFGHVLSLYANDKYLFVMTTFYSMNDVKIEKDPQLKLFRFDKSTLEMTELQHEMNNPWPKKYVFWQMIRVENDFVEGYMIKDGTDNSMTVVLARFDNEGKKLSSKEVPLVLKSSNTRETNGDMPLPPGVSRDTYKQNVLLYTFNGAGYALMMTPMTMGYLTYHPDAHAYFAYGFVGPGEQKKAGTKHTGFFVAKMDSSFALIKLQEHIDVPAITENGKLKVQAAPDSRYISGYACGSTDFLLELRTVVGFSNASRVHIQVNGSDLSLGKSTTHDVEAYFVCGARSASAGNILPTSSSVAAMNTKCATTYTVTPTRQYVVLHSTGKVVVLSDEVK